MIIICSVIVFLFISGCGKDTNITVTNSGWPDGTSISLIHKNHIAARTTLYGNRATLSARQGSNYTLRCASPQNLVSLISDLNIEQGNIFLTPPLPLSRHRIGLWRFGLTLSTDKPDSIYNELLTQTSCPLTTISLNLLNNPALTQITALAHTKGIEVTASVILDKHSLRSIDTIVDSAEVYGVDGLVIEADSMLVAGKTFGDELKKVAMILHDRGLTLSLRYPVKCNREKTAPVPQSISGFFTNTSQPHLIDEVRLAFICDGYPPVASYEFIEKTITEISRESIPRSVIAVEMVLTSFKYTLTDKGTLNRINQEPGELIGLMQTLGTKGVIQLNDGSLRFGYSGSSYAFEDTGGLSQKIKLLRTGILTRSGGIHITVDKFGMIPDFASLNHIADIIMSP